MLVRLDFAFEPKPIKVVGPHLHHFLALRQVSGAVVSTSKWITHRMRQLMFNEVRSEAQDFIQDLSLIHI